jgi:hypothetical protein
MPEVLTPTQKLAAVLLSRPLAEYVAEKRTSRPRWTWALIAEQLSIDTDGQVNINQETLRQWYGNKAAA